MKIVLIKEQNKKRRSIDLIAGHHEQGRQENIWAPVQKKLAPPPPILQIMILKLSLPRCVISKESVQQK